MAAGIGMPIPVETQEYLPSEYLASKERNVEVSPCALLDFPSLLFIVPISFPLVVLSEV